MWLQILLYTPDVFVCLALSVQSKPCLETLIFWLVPFCHINHYATQIVCILLGASIMLVMSRLVVFFLILFTGQILPSLFHLHCRRGHRHCAARKSQMNDGWGRLLATHPVCFVDHCLQQPLFSQGLVIKAEGGLCAQWRGKYSMWTTKCIV